MTLAELIDNTKKLVPQRIEYAKRDVVYKRIYIVKVRKYSVSSKRLTTIVEVHSTSNPHYYPYTKRDRNTVHTYDVKIAFHTAGMSLLSRITLRTGSERKWDPRPPKDEMKYLSPKTVPEYNIKRLGINPDFYYRQSWVRREQGVLYGRNYAPRPTGHANPFHHIWLTKHEWAVVQFLVQKGFIQPFIEEPDV